MPGLGRPGRVLGTRELVVPGTPLLFRIVSMRVLFRFCVYSIRSGYGHWSFRCDRRAPDGG